MGRWSSRGCIYWALACAWLVAGSQGLAALAQEPDDSGHAAAVRTFSDAVERYARLRARIEEPLPSFDARRDPWSLMLTRRYLASAIRAALPHAKQGDIFTPPVAHMFQELVAQGNYDVDMAIEGLVAADPEAAAFHVNPVVNEPVPAWAMQEVPAALLERLLPLPAAIEYRLVSGGLILWDTHAQIVIDALPDAFLVE